MLTLGINCAGRWTNVGVADGGAVIAEENLELGRRQTEKLPQIVQELLFANGLKLKDLRLIAAGTGPGYYTGIRAGVAYGAALAEALGILAVPLSSLEIYAWGLRDTHQIIAPFFKASVGRLYAAVYRRADEGLYPIMAQRFVSAADFACVLKEYPDASLVSPDMAAYDFYMALPNERITKESASGGDCALMGEKFGGRAIAPKELRGTYLRAPDIGPSTNS
ncbi:MAG: tRNA (adenosine(37)-N6)-threonylcarbamoyltransferase complex dimerization subunit type 1 TsaB [Cloacibacillus sp.]